jgi:hypothetical protein
MGALNAISEVVGQRIGGLFDRSFLFASLIPVVLFFAAGATGFALATGVPGTLAWLQSITAVEVAVLAVGLGIALVLAAQVLAALRQVLVALWSGLYPLCPPPPCRDWLERRQRTLRDDLGSQTQRTAAVVTDIDSKLRDRVLPIMREQHAAPQGLPEADAAARHALRTHGDRLLTASSATAAVSDIAAIEALYRQYAYKSLETEWRALMDALLAAPIPATHASNEAFANLERRFGGTLRPTTLGNLLEAQEAYPFRRYAIEGSWFWPRLAFVVPTETLGRLEDRRSFLDFWLAVASLSVVTVPTALALGPLLSPSPPAWLAAAAFAAFLAYVSYRLATLAADALGEQLCAACDMLRFDVAAGLRIPPARSLKAEKVEWELRVQQALYGTVDDFQNDVQAKPRPIGASHCAGEASTVSLC